MMNDITPIGDILNPFLERIRNFEITPEMEARQLEIQREDEARQLREAKEAEERRIDKIRIPKRYRRLSLDEYPVRSEVQESVVQYLRGYINRDLSDMENLIIHGYPGTGKTHMMCAFLQWCRKYRGEYWKLSSIMRRVKGNFSSQEETEEHFLKRLSEIPILVIDEVGRAGGTAYESSFMFDLLDNRYDNLLPTILVSNLPVEGETSMTSYLGISVMDRINENSLDIPCEWGNYRDHAEITIRTRMEDE
jgi:DNA replication protein DnaC